MLRKLPTDETAVVAYTEELNVALDGYERILSRTQYLAGDVRP